MRKQAITKLMGALVLGLYAMPAMADSSWTIDVVNNWGNATFVEFHTCGTQAIYNPDFQAWPSKTVLVGGNTYPAFVTIPGATIGHVVLGIDDGAPLTDNQCEVDFDTTTATPVVTGTQHENSSIKCNVSPSAEDPTKWIVTLTN